ncbi:hypothetical protein NI456_05055 [Brevundimonas diminuta]|uniref:hypothetical protein n=1 Tax=Brevundimonas diminuta TaxID=293 RepID=UPI0020975AA6|nr:hypothetical protein [Brevundimonas diminuta]MCO8018225.1 hypothetical protein [Brevundimonas diminuta]MCO8022251.1 hypothetical protein [Brevundimonas diminuta]
MLVVERFVVLRSSTNEAMVTPADFCDELIAAKKQHTSVGVPDRWSGHYTSHNALALKFERLSMSAQSSWTVSSLRIGLHEVGHAMVDVELWGKAPDCYCWAGEGAGGVAEPLGDIQNPTLDDYRNLATSACGGWAAVNLAISAGLLPAAPSGLEESHGDHGFLGDDTSDEGIVRRCAETLGESPDDLVSASKAQALAILKQRLPLLMGLANELVGMGFLEGREITARVIAVSPQAHP